jgi:hypothetical protein
MDTKQPAEHFDASFYADFLNEGYYLVREPAIKYNKPAIDNVRTNPPINPVVSIKIEKPIIPWIGNPQAGTFIILDYQGVDTIPQVDMDFLIKIFNAVKLGIDKIAILNISSYPVLTWQDLAETNANFIFGFGINGSLILRNISDNSLTNIDGKQVYNTLPLSRLMSEREPRATLWEAMKKMYLI